MTYLIVGLGNPGEEYRNTPHNAGFVALHELVKKLDAVPVKTKLLSAVWSARKEKDTVLLMEPHTFMNASGEPVAALMKSKEIVPEKLIVIHDELDLPLGSVRVSRNSSAAGHKGVQSIMDAIGTQDFTRVRIGIGPRPDKIPAEAYVLANLSADELKKLIEGITAAVTATTELLAS